MFSCEDDSLAGYFSVIIKPLDVFTETLSNSFRKRVAGFSKYNEGNRTYLTAAYLIAQLGKNFTDGTDKKISGDELLNEAWKVIQDAQYRIGGGVLFLEAEDNEHLLKFYQRNYFMPFNIRMSDSGKLIQLIRMVKQ